MVVVGGVPVLPRSPLCYLFYSLGLAYTACPLHGCFRPLTTLLELMIPILALAGVERVVAFASVPFSCRTAATSETLRHVCRGGGVSMKGQSSSFFHRRVGCSAS